ncbi:MAG TPA: DsbA family oxidoreductase [Rhodothermales bacterium]|nr:DsbA family oxidoreductase [Rhodothermales bacterium]
MKVEIYSDVACPWCYVGERRFARALGAFPQAEGVEVTFRPYQLDPSLPATPSPLRESLTRKFGAQLDAMLRQTATTAAADGLDLQFDRAQSVNTLEAHRLMRLALREGGPDVQRALAEGLFRAYFTDGLNVADPDVLADLAAEAGLDRERAAAYLATDEGAEEVEKEIAHAQRLGIRAVPTFVFDGRYAVQGAQPTSTFLQVLEEVQREAAGAVVGGEGDAEACDDGACAV